MTNEDALNRVCSNCNERFGQHFGGGRGHHYCEFKKYKYYDDHQEVPVDLKYVFIFSGTYRSKREKMKSTDPNVIFKMKNMGRSPNW